MTSTRKLMMALPISLVAAGLSAQALAATKPLTTTRMMRHMDKDRNGKVSRQEFAQYMGGAARARSFDRLDTNRNGQLETAELRPLASPNFSKCETLALQRGIAVNEREGHRPETTGPSPWRQFMDSCIAGKIR